MENVVEVVNLHKIYEIGKTKVHALRGVNLSVPKGEILAIVGPSGSGKSTLLHIIGTLDKPTEGKVFLEGVDVTQLKEGDLEKLRCKKIGFVFQSFNLLPILTAWENVEIALAIARYPKEKRKDRVHELLKLVGLEDRMDHRPSELSGGEQQRVAIARALANNPQLLLADEPTGELDSENSKMVMEIFRNAVKNEGATAIVVTHDLEVAKMADRILHLKDGRIVEG
ncbi:MAG: ABC transporter ATP-binding protein [Candidatus Njordarchaeia archaeon]